MAGSNGRIGRRLVLKALVASSFGSRLARGAPAMRRIGFLGSTPGATEVAETHQVLEPFGWIDGKNIVLIFRYDQHDAARREELAAELVRIAPDVLVTTGHAKTQALQRATSTIPIFAVVDDAIAEGFSKSLATPSGNITGLSYGLGDIDGKQIQLLLQVVPRLERLGYFHSARYVVTTESISGFVTAARAARVAVELFPVRDMGDLARGLQSLRGSAKSAAYIGGFGGVLDWKELAAHARDSRIQTLCDEPGLVEAGALMCYNFTFPNRKRQAGGILDKLLRGIAPSRIPFELPTHSFLSINRKTAKAIGIEIPAEILVRADKVIE